MFKVMIQEETFFFHQCLMHNLGYNRQVIIISDHYLLDILHIQRKVYCFIHTHL
jgi:hypothetical protein